MNINAFFEHLDRLFQEKKIEEAGQWIIRCRQEAQEEGNLQALLTILNEEIGYARSRGEHDRSRGAFIEAEKVMRLLKLPENSAMATTLLNGATAYRAAGEWKRSLELYCEAERIYRICGIQGTYENASLFNNMSLLYDQMGQTEAAVSCLKKAREIIAALPDCEAELATTDTNIGLMYLHHGQKGEALAAFYQAKKVFDSLEGEDAHYWSALGGLAQAYYELGDFKEAIILYGKAIDSVERSFGKNDAFFTLCDNCIFVCEQAGEMEQAEAFRRRKKGCKMKGLELCRKYYETCAKEALKECVPSEVYERMTIGLAGHGSECFGYDDELSADHDYGPSFCIWMNKEDMLNYGTKVEQIYTDLPKSFSGFPARIQTPEGKGRTGVLNEKLFFKEFLGMDRAPESFMEWLQIPEEWIAAACNGSVFKEGSGDFMKIRKCLLNYYPEDVRIKKIAARAAVMAQAGQYNYSRLMMRGDVVGAQLAISEFLKAAGSMVHLLNRKYMPYYKWMYRSLKDCEILSDVAGYMEELVKLPPDLDAWKNISINEYRYSINIKDHRVVYIETICRRVREALTEAGLISGKDAFLQNHLTDILSHIKDDALRCLHVMIG